MDSSELHTDSKPKILILASRGARHDPSAPLLRFARNHASTLSQFTIYATEGTGRSLKATGMFGPSDIVCKRSGPDGGVVELAAMVAREECATVIFLSDPKDLRSDVPENHALERVCRVLKVRLVTTLASAEHWAEHEAEQYRREWEVRARERGNDRIQPAWTPPGWEVGKSNVDASGEPIRLPVRDQTLALISHDRQKEEMVLFVTEHLPFLQGFHRILTTGTTGYLLKCLFCAPEDRQPLLKEARARLGTERAAELEESFWEFQILFGTQEESDQANKKALKELGDTRYARLNEKLQKRRMDDLRHRGEEVDRRGKLRSQNAEFVRKVMPLPSGPKGGDILIANEVIENRCHAVVFFQDPGTAHPHEPDIRLFERTCQFWSDREGITSVHATCVGDFQSAEKWVSFLSTSQTPEAMDRMPTSELAHRLRSHPQYGLREAIVVQDNPDWDGDTRGDAIARAAAGYFHQKLRVLLTQESLVRVGIAWGWGTMHVLQHLREMHRDKTISIHKEPIDHGSRLLWSPLIGNVTAQFRVVMIAAHPHG